MNTPAELSFEEILKFMLAHNGKVTNHDLVKHFKVFLMNPNMRDEARNTFKKHVNTLAIIKTQNNEKWLILKKKYFPSNLKENENETKTAAPVSQLTEEGEETPEEPPARPPLPLLNQDFNMLGSILPAHDPIVEEPAYQKSPVVTPQNASQESLIEDVPPKVHPRRKSEKSLIEKSSRNFYANPQISNNETIDMNETPTLTSSQSDSMLVDSEQKISVKERKQMFNRMASESDVLKSNKSGNNTSSLDEEDRASLDHKETEPLDTKQKQWILYAARGDYHVLAKMCKENSKLVKTKDPFTGYTAMHWACKRGDENLVKLLAGIHRHTVNERSNGGYTPLHIAMQFRRENVYRLLVEVYNADPNVRDWSGKKPRHYLVHMDTSLSPGSYRKKEGFLRIGSLNVRVKKTTEAFSNFLGVGATRSSAYVPKSARERELDRRSDDSDQLKSWGSADNIQKEDKMLPPINNKVRRRGASGRRGVASHSRSTPSTPDQPRAQIGVNNGDSDSDTAAGFHSAWRQQRASQS
ncbi:ankyrin repeat domain-containing protein SOWAHC [Pieris rapae]|uniref:ankyrin repeat domain-containing protein SOWAHC n=1 Tax=Pieris rapae TaxID=64459 RepID=UPI001E27D1D4|nr:ankyrin repeat domain-containing protein SOWAHC [Pieris rapae]